MNFYSYLYVKQSNFETLWHSEEEIVAIVHTVAAEVIAGIESVAEESACSTMRCLYNGVHPCGKCPACLANRQRAFCFRLDQERNSAAFYFWLTLTYNEVSIPVENGEYCFSKEHCRQFFEVLRKRYSSKGYKYKHFLVCEYGPNSSHRPHYHCLLLVYSANTVKELYNDRKEMRDFILEKAWPFGFVNEKSFHGRVLSYLTKYCTKPELLGEDHQMKPFTLISPGIGLSYLDKLTEDQKAQMIKDRDFSVRYGSGKMQLPRYYVDKIAPHSLEDLRQALPKPINQRRISSWMKFKEIQDLRRDLIQKNNEQVSQRLNYLLSSQGENMYDYLDHVRNAKFEEFRSKLRNRKDL